MDALFRLPNNDLSVALQKDKLFKEVEQQWNTVSSEEGNSRRKVDYEIYKSIVYNLEVRKVLAQFENLGELVKSTIFVA